MESEEYQIEEGLQCLDLLQSILQQSRFFSELDTQCLKTLQRTFSPPTLHALQALLCHLACTIYSCPGQKAFCVLTDVHLGNTFSYPLNHLMLRTQSHCQEGSDRGLQYAFSWYGCAGFHSVTPFIES